jgi:hypothetical protein
MVTIVGTLMPGVTRTEDDHRLRREAKQHVQLYLNEDEERLIRALRQANFWGAEALFTKIKHQRLAEDSALAQAHGAVQDLRDRMGVVDQLDKEGPGT